MTIMNDKRSWWCSGMDRVQSYQGQKSHTWKIQRESCALCWTQQGWRTVNFNFWEDACCDAQAHIFGKARPVVMTKSDYHWRIFKSSVLRQVQHLGSISFTDTITVSFVNSLFSHFILLLLLLGCQWRLREQGMFSIVIWLFLRISPTFANLNFTLFMINVFLLWLWIYTPMQVTYEFCL